jgi:hypothetical protein
MTHGCFPACRYHYPVSPGRERRRNGELAQRLQQLHAERLDVIALQKEYKELQEAHFQQVSEEAGRWGSGRVAGRGKTREVGSCWENIVHISMRLFIF